MSVLITILTKFRSKSSIFKEKDCSELELFLILSHLYFFERITDDRYDHIEHDYIQQNGAYEVYDVSSPSMEFVISCSKHHIPGITESFMNFKEVFVGTRITIFTFLVNELFSTKLLKALCFFLRTFQGLENDCKNQNNF